MNDELRRFIFGPPPYGFLIGVAMVVATVLASVVYRRAADKPMFMPGVDGALFVERWRSGRLRRNLLTRFGGASNCLWVIVKRDALLVGPHFPFNLMFLPEIYGLELRVRPADIVALDERRTLFGGKWLRVAYRRDGVVEQLDLSLKDPVRFRESLTTAGAPIDAARDNKAHV